MADSANYPDLTWERRPNGTDHGPLAYFNDEHGYAIFPEEGGNGWEWCEAKPGTDAGYSYIDRFETVAEAKHAAARDVVRSAQNVG